MDASKAFDRRDDVTFLDVREPPEWHAGHIEGARHIPLMQLPARLAEIERERDVVTVCKSGHRSEMAARWLRAQGISAHNLEGGMESWARRGLPFVADHGGPPTVA